MHFILVLFSFQLLHPVVRHCVVLTRRASKMEGFLGVSVTLAFREMDTTVQVCMPALVHADTMFLGYVHTIPGSSCADPKKIHKNDDSEAIFVTERTGF